MRKGFVIFLSLLSVNLFSQDYTLTIDTGGKGSVTKDPEKASYSTGDTVTLTVVPDNGYIFDHWEGEGFEGDFRNKCSMNPKYIIMNKDYSVTVVFRDATLPAFPGAEGGGMYTVGGRGGIVIEVTNLNSSGPGSFREACMTEGPRTIVFRVGGTIDLGGEDIVMDKDELSNITIAGQTAPGGGIQIKGGAVQFRVNDSIIRYVRFRLGPVENADAVDVAASGRYGNARYHRNRWAILDHVSAYWGVDETLDPGAFSDNITLQWSIVAEGLHESVYTEHESWDPYYTDPVTGVSYWAHSRGVMISEWSRNISIHHCLIYNSYKRNPLIQSSDCDMVNNIMFSRDKMVYVQPYKGNTRTNWIGNYFRSFAIAHRPVRFFESDLGWDDESGAYFYDNYHQYFRPDARYREDAVCDVESTDDAAGDGHVHILTSPYAFNYPQIISQPVKTARNLVLDDAGATLPMRDSTDIRVIATVRADGDPPYNINDPSEVGGWPEIASGEAPDDSDHDGMPDDWENDNGLNPNDASDRNSTDLSPEGYTNLEVYLNYIVEMCPTTIDDSKKIVSEFTLKHNYPNPFNPTTTIEYSLDRGAEVSIAIYSITGERVRVLINQHMSAGNHKIEFNGQDNYGRALSSGFYFYRLTRGSKTITKKMLLIK